MLILLVSKCLYISWLLVFRVGDFTHPYVWEVAEDKGVADAMNERGEQ